MKDYEKDIEKQHSVEKQNKTTEDMSTYMFS